MGMIQTDWVNSYVDPRGRDSRQSKRKREKNPRGEASVNTAHSYGPIAQTVYSTLIRHQVTIGTWLIDPPSGRDEYMPTIRGGKKGESVFFKRHLEI